MKRDSIRAYEPRYAAQGAELLAAVRSARRAAFPALGRGLDEASISRGILDGLPGGFVALDDGGGLAGFLSAERVDDPIWGDAVEVGIDRWACAPVGAAPVGVEPAAAPILARLYAAAFEPLTAGAPEHRVYCPASDPESLRCWFSLGFGMEQAYGAALLDDLDAMCETMTGIEIRRAGPGDEEALEGLSPLIATAQTLPPVWAGAPPAYLADIREGYRGLASDKDAIVLLALRGAKALGFQAWFPMEPDAEKGIPEGAAELSVAATVPEERGRGLGLALTARGIAEARGAGYSIAFTDWRTTNPLSSAFWRSRGFKPYLYRLARRLDPRVL
jgi:ribosomal protein S18 acetylase RimI-like enzyme